MEMQETLFTLLMVVSKITSIGNTEAGRFCWSCEQDPKKMWLELYPLLLVILI
jgi:hypothetical protein